MLCNASLIHHLIDEDSVCLMGVRSQGAKQVLNQFIIRVAEKLSALRTASYFKERAARADVARVLELLERAGDEPPREGDEIAG